MTSILSVDATLPNGKEIKIDLKEGDNPVQLAIDVCNEQGLADDDAEAGFEAVWGAFLDAADSKGEAVLIEAGDAVAEAKEGEASRTAGTRVARAATHVEDEGRDEYAERVANALAEARLEKLIGFSLRDVLPGEEDEFGDDDDSDIGPPTEPASPAKMPQVPSEAAEDELRQRKRAPKPKPESKSERIAREKREADLERQYQQRKAREDAQCATSLVAVLAGFLIAAVLAALSIMIDSRVDRSVPMAVGLVIVVLTAMYQSFMTKSDGSTLDEESVHPLVWTMGGAGMGCMIGSMAGDILVNMGMGLRDL